MRTVEDIRKDWQAGAPRVQTIDDARRDVLALLAEVDRLRGLDETSDLSADTKRYAAEELDADAARAVDLARLRARRDELDAKLRAHDGGDRPMSPPVSLIRELDGVEQQIRDIEGERP